MRLATGPVAQTRQFCLRLGRDLRPAYVNGQVLSFGPAALLERFAKGAKHRRERRRRPDHGYAPNPTSLLRTRRERPRRRAAEQRYELPPPHVEHRGPSSRLAQPVGRFTARSAFFRAET